MNALDLTNMWLANRATELRVRADKVESAYTKDPLKSACDRVANAYRAAAEVLESARKAPAIEDAIKLQVRILFEREGRKIAEKVQALLPPGVGFMLFVFDFGEGGNIAYLSNAQRPDARKAIAEWLQRTGADR